MAAIPHGRPEATENAEEGCFLLSRILRLPSYLCLEGPGGGPREGKPYLQKIEQFISEDITRSQFLTLEMFKGFNETYSASIQAQG